MSPKITPEEKKKRAEVLDKCLGALKRLIVARGLSVKKYTVDFLRGSGIISFSVPREFKEVIKDKIDIDYLINLFNKHHITNDDFKELFDGIKSIVPKPDMIQLFKDTLELSHVMKHIKTDVTPSDNIKSIPHNQLSHNKPEKKPNEA